MIWRGSGEKSGEASQSMADATTHPVSHDRLWQWDGKTWQHVPDIAVVCPSCGEQCQAQSSKKVYRCANGHDYDFVRCVPCGGTFHRSRKHRDYAARCPFCGQVSQWPASVDAWTWAENQSMRGLWPPGSSANPDCPTVRNLLLAASVGSQLRNGEYCTLSFALDGVTIDAHDGLSEYVAINQILAIEVAGTTTTTQSGGGVIGGGFGLQGAAEGILAASVINALTTSSTTTINTVLRLASDCAEYVLVSHAIDSNALRMLLTPVQLRVRQAQTPRPTQPALSSTAGSTLSIADELTKLAHLRDQGVLTIAEFEAAKAKLLGT